MSNTKDLLIKVQQAFPQALGFIILNEGQGVEVYADAGKQLALLPMATFKLLFMETKETEGTAC